MTDAAKMRPAGPGGLTGPGRLKDLNWEDSGALGGTRSPQPSDP
jgi:hypothetical protein